MNEEQAAGEVNVLTSPWYIAFLKYNPVPVLERTRIPVLAINGSLDLQVLPEQNLGAINQALRKAGNTRYTVKEFPGLNHLFQTAKTGLVDEYGRIQERISPEVLEFICSWIIARPLP